jgi:hypothetical protein
VVSESNESVTRVVLDIVMPADETNSVCTCCANGFVGDVKGVGV